MAANTSIAPPATTTAGTKLSTYDLVIGILALFSLIILLLLIFAPLSASTRDVLNVLEDGLCVVFLFDFFRSLYRAPRKWGYFLRGGGWLDLLGSIPFSGLAVFRVARLFRIVRVLRTLRGNDFRIMLTGRLAESTLLFTLVIALMLIFVIAGIVTQAEHSAPNANIKTYPEAVWWGFVTICTVGYGDYYPVTTVGRASAIVLMFGGIGLIGVLSSYLATTFISFEQRRAARRQTGAARPARTGDEATAKDEHATTSGNTELTAIREELAANREELAALRRLLEARSPIQ